jgi:hypothetical protein
LVFGVLACTGLARAAETAPEYQKLRYEEDYRYLRFPDARGDFFDPIKYLPITSDGAAYLSLGGMLPERYEYQSNPLWGDGSQDRSGVFLQRYLLHADLRRSAWSRGVVCGTRWGTRSAAGIADSWAVCTGGDQGRLATGARRALVRSRAAR